jgi:hypothetical protein
LPDEVEIAHLSWGFSPGSCPATCWYDWDFRMVAANAVSDTAPWY